MINLERSWELAGGTIVVAHARDFMVYWTLTGSRHWWVYDGRQILGFDSVCLALRGLPVHVRAVVLFEFEALGLFARDAQRRGSLGQQLVWF
jgi:hypothetical protein